MSPPRAVPARARWLWVLLPLACSAAALALGPSDAFQAVEALLYDVRLRTFSPPATRSESIVILALDDRTMQDIARNPQYARNYGNYPYSRRLWARVVDHLMNEGARALVMDSVMDEPDVVPDNDVALAQTISDRRVPFYLGFDLQELPENRAPPPRIKAVNLLPGDPRLVLPESVEDTKDPLGAPAGPPPLTEADRLRALAFPVAADHMAVPALVQFIPKRIARTPMPPVDPVLRVGAGFGLVLPEQDSDGRLRRTRFAYTDGFNTFVTLPVAVAADLLGASTLELAPGRLRLGKRAFDVNAGGDAGLDYGGTVYERFDTFSLVRVLNDWDAAKTGAPRRLPKDVFRDKVVLVGGFALGTYDVKSTPFSRETVGVTKAAVELDSLLTGRFIVEAGGIQVCLLTLLLTSLAVVTILSSRSVVVELTLPLFGLGLLFLVTGLLLARWKLHVPFTVPASALASASLFSVAFNHLFANREREQMRAIFSRYLARQVADQLAEAGELPRLDGESREITAFFSDIKGFSTFSEGFKDNPQGLVKLLNTYLTRVSGVLQEHGGCLDKYIGDAVVCIFGAPLRMPTHAIDACHAALHVQAELVKLRAEFKAQGLPDVYTRIGVNSAVMFVGNFGSEQLFSYTAMGDGMNLASRLEGANKAFGTLIMIGSRTYEMAKDAIEARELDWVRVAGKTEAVAVYELLAVKGELPELKRKVVALYGEALAHYRAARFADALEVLRHAADLDAGDGPTQTLIERCEGFLASPPELPFDGVAKLEK